LPNHPPEVITLADWRISAEETLSIQLWRPSGLAAISRTLAPSTVKIVWPSTPTELYVNQWPDAAAVAASVFAESATRLSQLRARNRYL
jgi:hypothetical protein